MSPFILSKLTLFFSLDLLILFFNCFYTYIVSIIITLYIICKHITINPFKLVNKCLSSFCISKVANTNKNYCMLLDQLDDVSTKNHIPSSYLCNTSITVPFLLIFQHNLSAESVDGTALWNSSKLHPNLITWFNNNVYNSHIDYDISNQYIDPLILVNLCNWRAEVFPIHFALIPLG